MRNIVSVVPNSPAKNTSSNKILVVQIADPQFPNLMKRKADKLPMNSSWYYGSTKIHHSRTVKEGMLKSFRCVSADRTTSITIYYTSFSKIINCGKNVVEGFLKKDFNLAMDFQIPYGFPTAFIRCTARTNLCVPFFHGQSVTTLHRV